MQLSDPVFSELDRITSELRTESMLNLRHLQIKLQSLPPVLESIVDVIDRVSEFTCSIADSANELRDIHCNDGGQILRTLRSHIQSLIRNARFLNTRADSTAQLFAEGLMLKDQKIAQQLASSSKEQTQIMCEMTRMTARDSASIRVITVATLIYLPTMFVAVSACLLPLPVGWLTSCQTLFGSQPFYLDDDHKLQASVQLWILFAVSAPLTAITFLYWQIGKRRHDSDQRRLFMENTGFVKEKSV